MTINCNLVTAAEIYATAAHGAINQRRKYTDEPYITHPQAVAALVSGAGGTPQMVAAAWLHDVAEDTGCTIDGLETMFGLTIATYVNWLTEKQPEPGQKLNRAQRKKAECQRIADAPVPVKTIKLADLIHNTSSITQHDPKFAKIYMAEKKELIWCLKDGHHKLLCQATQLIQDYEQGLLDQALSKKQAHKIMY